MYFYRWRMCDDVLRRSIMAASGQHQRELITSLFRGQGVVQPWLMDDNKPAQTPTSTYKLPCLGTCIDLRLLLKTCIQNTTRYNTKGQGQSCNRKCETQYAVSILSDFCLLDKWLFLFQEFHIYFGTDIIMEFLNSLLYVRC